MTEHTSKTVTFKTWRRILLLLAAFITAVAVAITCAVCFDGSDPVKVGNTVESDNVATSAANSYNYTVTGTLIKNGDVKNFTTVTSYAIKIPRGTYKLEVWGGRGGQYSGTPGYGGYTYGTYTTNTEVTLYLYVGGVGTNGNSTNSSKAGGYNGGGAGMHYGSGGGGATHFATRDGLLSSLNGYRSNVLIVAGGGGGSQSRAGGNGGGGSRNGVKCPSTSYGTGGCGGGTGGAHGDMLSGHSSGSESGSFGQGGTGRNGSDGLGGGGGGGGYFGGCGVTSDVSRVDDKGGGGGSGYINTSYISGGNGTSGANNGAGKARLTAINVNTPPTTPTTGIYTVAGSYYRGSVNINVLSSQIARDPDYQNTSGASASSVYFTAGNSSNYNTLPASNAGLYLDSACTKVASNYLSWTWNGNMTTLNINNIKRFPRSNVDGQANGQFHLFARVRDNFGSTTQHGVSVIQFNLNVSDRPLTANVASVRSLRNDLYRVGKSTSNSTSKDFISDKTSIYHSGATGQNTVFLPKPISPSDKNSYTIYASDIYTDADTSYDKVAFKSLSIPSNVSSYFTITYNADNNNYASGLYPSISIKATGVRPTAATYVTLRITAQSSETTPKLGMVVSTGSEASVDLVFKISNTRPYFASSTLNTANQTEPLVRIAPGASDTVSLNSMVYDIDDGANITSTFVTSTGGVKIPTNEYIQVDITNTPVALKTSSAYYLGNSSGYGQGAVNTTSGFLSKDTGESTDSYPTGFAKDLVAAAGSNGASTANVVYSFENSNRTIRFTARAATQNQYRNPAGRLGHFYVLVRVVDPSDSADGGIWYPIAIEVSSQAPSNPTPYGNITLDFDFEKGDDAHDFQRNEARSKFLTPISYVDDNGVLHGIGYHNSTEYQATPFAVDADGFTYANGALNDFAVLNCDSEGGGAVLDNDAGTTGTFFTVSPVRLTAPISVFSRVPSSNYSTLGILPNADGLTATFWGLQVTPLRSTDNEFFRFNVKVKDSHGTVNDSVPVCVKVENREVSPRRDPASGTSFAINAISGNKPRTPYGSYGMNTNVGQMAVNYTIENMDEIQLTPYDFAYDLDMDPNNTVLNYKSGGSVVYNTNPLDGGFHTAAEFITRPYNIAHSASTSDNPSKSNRRAQTLSFVNPSGIVTAAEQFGGYIGTEVTNVKVGSTEYDIPCIKITGRSRTTSAIVQLRFEVTDGFSSVQCLVTVTVLNSSPLLNTKANHPLGEGETDNDRMNEPYSMSATVSSRGLNNSYAWTAREIAYDKDNDTPTFLAGTARIAAKVGDKYYHYLDANFNGVTDKAASEDMTRVTYTLSDYVYATITKDESGIDIVYVSALSSTELFPVPVYLEFQVQDGFRAQMGISTLYLLIEVKNSDPVMHTDGLTLRREDVDHPENNEYAWMINYDNRAELNQTRYIANCEELYNSVNAPASNKIWLFDDADAQQRSMVNPASANWTAPGATVNSDNLVAKFDNADNAGRLPITSDKFADNALASVIYTPMYHSLSGDDKYIDLTVKFYERTVSEDGSVSFALIPKNDQRIKTAQYWLIELSDKHTEGITEPIQIAIAVKDNHHGKILHSSADKSELNEDPDVSAITVYNFYYGYNKPGVTAMHSYYRTDGNAEAETESGSVGGVTTYLVDEKAIDAFKHFKNQSDVTEFAALGSDRTARQNFLKTVEFADNFKYQYFVKKCGTESEPTYKVFPNNDSPFLYSPIDVAYSAVNQTVNVPMSYIAMPSAHGNNTETDGEHVAFANATAASTVSPGTNEKLIDGNYATWTTAQREYVYENLTLSDGTTSWTGANLNNNPYINIRYITSSDRDVSFASRYVNSNQYTLSAPGAYAPLTNVNFREDKYGFAFSKKSSGDSVRAPGLLKLTIAVKTLGLSVSGTPTKIENVEVEINLVNTRPSVTYMSESSNNGQLSTVAVNMTMGDTDGVTLDLKRDDSNSDHSRESKTIFYSDRDKTASANSAYIGDTMKFYMPSAFGSMSSAEIDYFNSYGISSSSDSASAALQAYYGVSSLRDILDTPTTEQGKVNKYDFNPNPNFDKFFSVSPSSGAASAIQFIPKAKTQPKFPDSMSADKRNAFLTKYNLRYDNATRLYYYPFKVLFYDDCDGSPFTSGYWTLATIKVFITNNRIVHDGNTVKNTYESTSPNTAGYAGKPMYMFDLSAGASFFVDVSSLLIDNDIDLDSVTKTLVTSDAAMVGDDKYIKDYLKMPQAADGINLNVVADPSARTPVTVKRGGDDDATSTLPETTLVFETQKAFNGRTHIAYTFEDSSDDAASSVTIVFSIGYNNVVPKAHTETFSGSDTIDVYMKHGDYFDVYAGDSTLFSGDADGGFVSASSGVLGAVNFPFDEDGHSGTTAENAATMYAGFSKYIGSYPATPNPTVNGVSRMGAIVLGSDDAPSTLRIQSRVISSEHSRLVSVTQLGNTYRSESDAASSLPVALRVRAQGAVTTTLTVTLVDGSAATVTVYIRIHVLSTPPAVNAAISEIPAVGNPSVKLSRDTTKDNTYNTSISYGTKVRFAIASFMSDIDIDDSATLNVYTGMDGTEFAIANPGDSSTVTAQAITENHNNYIELNATDFIDNVGKTTEVRFRIVDRNGSVSDYISFKVSIAPKTVTAVADPRRIELMSYAEFSDSSAEGNGSVPISVKLISEDNTAIFRDEDINAPSAAYDVFVYAQIKKTGDSFVPARVDELVKSEALIGGVENGVTKRGSVDSEIFKYVSQFFTASVTFDGKTLEFIPNSATFNAAATAISDIPLYIEVSKHYSNDSTQTTTMDAVASTVNASVANSGITAVANSPFNSGYPHVNDKPRESDFLEFSGKAGDSLTWKLYNTEDYELGLFYDWDMRKAPAGKEKIVWVGHKVVMQANESITGKGDVLSISHNGLGADQTVTIKINRKVYPGTAASTPIDVYIYTADAIGSASRPNINDESRVCYTKIRVNVENDTPEIATTGLVLVCPFCGDDEHVRQVPGSATTARCSNCNNTFKSLDPDLLGYTVSLSSVDGYVLDAKLENGKSLALNVNDIIDDADIEMDGYSLVSLGSSDSLLDSTGKVLNAIVTGDNKKLFDISVTQTLNSYGVQTLSRITFTCRSTTRGQVGTVRLQIQDSVDKSTTNILTINLTVDNIAPTAKPNTSRSITMMGAGSGASESDIAQKSKTFNILDFVTDANGDAFDANDPANANLFTYVFIDEIIVYMTDDLDNKPSLYGPGVFERDENGNILVDEETGNNVYAHDTLCTVEWADEAKHQSFKIVPFKQVYGVQKFTVTVSDSGYSDGVSNGIIDGKTSSFTFTVTIANPLEDVPDELAEKDMVYGVTRTVTAKELLGEENSMGYEISAMEEIDTTYLKIYEPGSSVVTSATSTGDWRIYAGTEDVNAKVRVTFTAGGITISRTLPIHVVVNNAPVFKNGKKSYIYMTKDLTDKANRTVRIYPEEWFEDRDAEDVMTFIAPVQSSQTVKVEAERAIDDNGRAYILLKFNRRGESDITVNVTDLSGRSYSRTVTVNCTDAPEMSWWENFVSIIEANWLWFWVIVGGSLLLIILLIVIIVVATKKRKMRREIEALLESETELEEEMMRLSAGPAGYQSFGYLPPTQHAVDPGLMLGGGATAPVQSSLQLNAGTGATPTGTSQQQLPPAGATPITNTPPQPGAQQNMQRPGVPPQQQQMQQGAPRQPQQTMQQPGIRPQQPPVQPRPQQPAPPPSDGFNPDDF